MSGCQWHSNEEISPANNVRRPQPIDISKARSRLSLLISNSERGVASPHAEREMRTTDDRGALVMKRTATSADVHCTGHGGVLSDEDGE